MGVKKTTIYSLLVIGITAISSQIILIRELFTAFYGNELSFGFILALWLLGGAVGSGFLGSIFADKIDRKLPLFSVVQVLLSILIPSSIIFVRITRTLFGVGVGEIIGLPAFLANSGLALFPISLGLGFLFVLGCKIISESSSAVGIGRVYTLEAIGAMIGGTVTSLVLIRYFGALQIAFMLSFLNLLSAAFILPRQSAQNEKYLKTISLLLIFLLAVFAISGKIELMDKKSLEFKWAGFKVLKSTDSIYGRITVTEKDTQFNFFNNGLFLFSSHDPLSSEEAVHFSLIFCPDPKDVLLIGGGSTQIMQEILKYPVSTVDYVELDPLVISLSKEFLKNEPFYRLDDPRVNIINEDGRHFIQDTEKSYDAVIINLPNPYTAQINRFYTEEFFKEVKKILSENAVVSFSVGSSENYLSREQSLFLKTIFETARAEFQEVKIVPGDTAYFILANKKGVISLNPEDIIKRLEQRGIKTIYVRDYYLFSKLSDERIDYLYRAINQAGGVRKNMDFYPVSYFYDMVLWSTYFSFQLSKFFMFFTRKVLLCGTFFFFALLFIVFLTRRRTKNFRREATLLALGTTGLSEISFEILIVLAFQIIYGYLYYKIGIIITSFMFGLYLGSLYITRKLTTISRPYKTYTIVQVFVFIYPLILLLAFKVFASSPFGGVSRGLGANIFAVLPFIAGFVGGIQYPLANKICFGSSGAIGKTAGITYAVDLLGSFVGALLLSSFFVPLVGISTTCILLAGLNLVSLALLLAGVKRNSASP